MRGIIVVIAALCVFSSCAFAEQEIGAAASIEKDVQGAVGGQGAHLNVGDSVYFDEVLTTGAGSRGKFAFVDRTNLQMGPSSRVKLDSFVYAGGSGVTFNAAKGAFRFVTAPGAHKSYEVRTPTASIGVRGTNFATRVTSRDTTAVIYNGSIEVCDAAGGNCQILDKPCTFVVAGKGGVTAPKTVGKYDWSFDKTCKGAPPPPGDRGSNAPPPGAPVPPPSGGSPGTSGGLPVTNGGSPVTSGGSPGTSGEQPVNWGGPSFGVTLGPTIGDGSFADPVPMNGAAFSGGLKLGYGFMLTPNFFAGFETDGQYRGEIGGSTNGHGTTSSSRPGYLGTARLKFGYAFDRFLVYGTGGLAYGHIIAPKSFSGPNVLGPAYSFGASQDNAFLPGWTVGAGASYALTRNISVNAEYLYIKLEHHFPRYSTNVALYPVPVCNISGMHGLRFGVNFSFSPQDLLGPASGR
jgi:outer membrane immunogenic protein